MIVFDHPLRAKRFAARFHETFLLEKAIDEICDRLAFLNVAHSRVGWLRFKDESAGAATHPPSRQWLPLTIVTDQQSTERIIQVDDRLDGIVVPMTLHWVNDLPGLLIQIRRCLQPGGLFLAAFPGGHTLHELRSVLLQSEDEITGGATIRISPFVDTRTAGQLMARAGFLEPVSDSLTVSCTYKDAIALMHDLRAMNESNALRESVRRPLRRDVLARACRLYRELYPAADGRIRATFELVCLTGWAPSEPV